MRSLLDEIAQFFPAIAARISPFQNPESNDSDALPAANDANWLQAGISSRRLTGGYQKALAFIFRYPAVGIAFGASLPILGFVASTQLQEQFFPPADRDQIHIELELSPTSSLAGTLETTEAIREVLLAEEEVTRVDWFIGESAPAFYYNLIPRRKNVSQYAQALVQFNTFENQAELIHRLQAK